jgi:hypothetical protein
MLSSLVRRVTLLAALGLVALSSACSRTEERPVNAWLKVRVRTPKTAGGGMIQVGPDARVWVSDCGQMGVIERVPSDRRDGK